MTGIDIAILGAAGMGGGELLRFLLQHPHARIGQLVSRSQAGRKVTEVHPHLQQLGSMEFCAGLVAGADDCTDPLVVFSAMGHAELARQYAELDPQLADIAGNRRLLLVDLSADFRLDDPGAWQKYYGSEHPCPQSLQDFVYGLPEMNREQISRADRIASPGCFATAVNLCLLPLATKLAGMHVAVSAATGSSGSGILPTAGTHHPHRAHDFRAYGMLRHRHQAEMEMVLARHGSDKARISFVPHSAPMVRGIFATMIIECADEAQAAGLAELVHAFYALEPLVELVQDSPRVAVVAGSGRAQLHASHNGRILLVMSAIDNLGKGMAAQAIQNMNIALGLPEDSGISHCAVYP